MSGQLPVVGPGLEAHVIQIHRSDATAPRAPGAADLTDKPIVQLASALGEVIERVRDALLLARGKSAVEVGGLGIGEATHLRQHPRLFFTVGPLAIVDRAELSHRPTADG